MAHRRHWLIPLFVALLVACGQSATPPAPPGVTPTVAFLPLASPTSASNLPPATDTAGSAVAPTRTVSGALPTATVASVGDALYIDPQGRFSITVPKEWQSRAGDAAGSTLVSFSAADGSAGLIIDRQSLPLGTTAKEFAASTDKANAGKMTTNKKQGQESLTVGNVPAEALTYQGTVATREYLFRQILLAQGVDGWSITFPLDPAARQRYGPLVDGITQSFSFGTPIGKTLVATGASTTTVGFPTSALDWKADTPIAAGVPVRLPDAGVIAQLNGVTFTARAGGKAVLGTDEQFLIADMTIWNTGPTAVVPMPDQCNVTQEHGAISAPETVEIATDVVSGKVPPFGTAGIASDTGIRGTLVIRVSRQPGLLIINYRPTTTRASQPVQFYVKP